MTAHLLLPHRVLAVPAAPSVGITNHLHTSATLHTRKLRTWLTVFKPLVHGEHGYVGYVFVNLEHSGFS